MEGDNSGENEECHSVLTTASALQKFWLAYALINTFALPMFENKLVQLDLSEKGAKLYLLLLQVGSSPVSALAKRAHMKRVTVYSVLEILVEQGLVSYEHFSIGRRYSAYDPECLLYLLEKEKAELKCRMELARECVQKLNNPQVLRSPVLF